MAKDHPAFGAFAQAHRNPAPQHMLGSSHGTGSGSHQGQVVTPGSRAFQMARQPAGGGSPIPHVPFGHRPLSNNMLKGISGGERGIKPPGLPGTTPMIAPKGLPSYGTA
jgi:hypothetical protein